MEFTFEPAYGRPHHIKVFAGELYRNIGTNLSSAEDIRDLGVVVALTPEKDEGEQPEHNGPDVILFNRTMYQKAIRQPVNINLEIIRTVPAPSPFIDYPVSLPEDIVMEDDNSGDVQLSSNNHVSSASQHRQPELRSPTPSPQPSPRTISGTTLRNLAPPPVGVPTTPQGCIPLPPRSFITDPTPLAYGFDLPPSVLATANTTFTVPFTHSKEYFLQRGIVVAPGTSHPRTSWPAEVLEHLWYLVELGMLQKNRALAFKEYKVVTEALHRRFVGTSIGGQAYVEKGYNGVHSKVFRDRGYKDMVARVLG
ncbi:hypothetical protein VTL71DRAFT_3504 [Oculimacula yallundae]|uniref:Uncharacterized protein n=1 Tax=Oculimacula yallundae TaxID=86028 RepID=A0ABR4C7G2_9HELO